MQDTPKQGPQELEAGRGRDRARAAPARGPRRLFLVFLVVAGALGALLYVAYRGGRIVTDDAYVDASLYSVQTRIPGTVLEVFAQEHAPVEAGQLLVRLDPEQPAIQVELAQGQLDAARRQLDEAKIAAGAARAETHLADAQLDQARKDLTRIEALWRKKTVSEDRYDRAVTQSRVLTARKSAAEAQLRLSEARIETARAAVEIGASRLAEAKLHLAYTEIRAPGRGIVSKKDVEPGMVVGAGTPLMAVVDLQDLWVEANYKETQLDRIRPGLEALVRVDTFPDRVFHGVVEGLQAGSGAAFSLFPPENATGNWVKVVQRIPVKVLLKPAPGEGDATRLRMGMSAEVTVIPAERPFLSRLFSFLPGL